MPLSLGVKITIAIFEGLTFFLFKNKIQCFKKRFFSILFLCLYIQKFSTLQRVFHNLRKPVFYLTMTKKHEFVWILTICSFYQASFPQFWVWVLWKTTSFAKSLLFRFLTVFPAHFIKNAGFLVFFILLVFFLKKPSYFLRIIIFSCNFYSFYL